VAVETKHLFMPVSVKVPMTRPSRRKVLIGIYTNWPQTFSATSAGTKNLNQAFGGGLNPQELTLIVDR
jgi:hypothetical protein